MIDALTVIKYLRLDEDSVDDDTLDLCMHAAKETVEAAVGSFDESKARVWILFLSMVQELYDNRQILFEGKSNAKQYLSRMHHSLLLQLQVENLGGDPGED